MSVVIKRYAWLLSLIDVFCLYTPAFQSTEKSIILYEKKEHWKPQIVLHLQQKQKGLFEWLASEKSYCVTTQSTGDKTNLFTYKNSDFKQIL